MENKKETTKNTKRNVVTKLEHGNTNTFISECVNKEFDNVSVNKEFDNVGLELKKPRKEIAAFISKCVNKEFDNVDLEGRKKLDDALRNDKVLLKEVVLINEKIVRFLDEPNNQNILITLIKDKPQLIENLSPSQKTDDSFIQKLCGSKTEKTWGRYYCEIDKDIKIEEFPQQKYTYSKGVPFPIRKNSSSLYDYILLSGKGVPFPIREKSSSLYDYVLFSGVPFQIRKNSSSLYESILF
jgi:hypothetical protein